MTWSPFVSLEERSVFTPLAIVILAKKFQSSVLGHLLSFKFNVQLTDKVIHCTKPSSCSVMFMANHKPLALVCRVGATGRKTIRRYDKLQLRCPNQLFKFQAVDSDVLVRVQVHIWMTT